VPNHFIPKTPERNSPTLWPQESNDLTSVEFAVLLCEQENRALKKLVASLSEIILKTV
jgi:hypothetical protein